MDEANRKAFLAGMVAFVIMTVIFAVLQFGFTQWSLWQQFSIIDDEVKRYFCEHAYMDEIFRERMNTWSNLPFLFSGIWMIHLGIRDIQSSEVPANLIQQHPVYSLMFGFVMIHLFLGSSLFHASLTILPQQWDMSGVFSLVAAPFIYNLHKAYNLSKYRWTGALSPIETRVSITLGVVLFAILTALKWQLDEFIVVPLFIVATGFLIGYLHKKTYTNTKFLWWAIVCIIIGIVSFLLDLNKIACDPKSYLQLHALWHVSIAFGALLLYLYFRSETSSQ